jgi:hypothetical protein
MDFTTAEEVGISASEENYTSLNTNNKEKGNFFDTDYVNLINENRDLIQDCLKNKNDTILSSNELEKYGSLALSAAALECVNQKVYRSFAKQRLEVIINRAIAEAHLILELQGKIFDNNKVVIEFASIEETYC